MLHYLVEPYVFEINVVKSILCSEKSLFEHYYEFIEAHMIVHIEPQMLLLIILKSLFNWVALVVHFWADEAACPIRLLYDLIREKKDCAVVLVMNRIPLDLIIKHLLDLKMKL